MGCHDSHAGSAYPIAASGMKPPAPPRRSRHSIRFPRPPVFGMRLSSRSVCDPSPLRPPARTAGNPRECVMRCHDPHAGNAYPMAASGMTPPVPPRALQAFRPVSPASRFWHEASPPDPSSFRSPRRRAERGEHCRWRRWRRRPVPRCGGTLIRALCARAPAPVGARFAAARFARLIAPVRPRARARCRTHLSCPFRPSFFAPAPTRRDTASGRRSRLLFLFYSGNAAPRLQVHKTTFPEFFCHGVDLTGIKVALRAHARPPPGTPSPGPGRLLRKVAVRFGRAAGKGCPVVPSCGRPGDRRMRFGQRESTRRACSSRAARSRSFGGG